MNTLNTVLRYYAYMLVVASLVSLLDLISNHPLLLCPNLNLNQLKQIVCMMKTYVFRAASRDQQLQWVIALRKCIQIATDNACIQVRRLLLKVGDQRKYSLVQHPQWPIVFIFLFFMAQAVESAICDEEYAWCAQLNKAAAEAKR